VTLIYGIDDLAKDLLVIVVVIYIQ
jgi:hypothetical protein